MPPSLITRLATAEANINIQLALLVLHALLWHVITTWAAKRIAPWCQAQPWIERFRARAGSTLRRGYGITFADEDDMFALVTLVAAILCVHLTGGLLCVPALLARRPTPLVVARVEIKFRRPGRGGFTPSMRNVVDRCVASMAYCLTPSRRRSVTHNGRSDGVAVGGSTLEVEGRN